MTIDDLKNYGADIESGLRRCMNNESFYLRLVSMTCEDANFKKLYDALEAKDLDLAFDAAHALKGACSNLALTPLVEPAVEITENLRAKTDMDYSNLIAKIKEAQKKLIEIVKE